MYLDILAFLLLATTNVYADCTDAAVWGLSNVGRPVRSLHGTDETLDGNYVQITGRYYNEAVAINAQDEIWHYYNGQWQKLPGAAVWASIGIDGNFWVVNRAGLIYGWDAGGNDFIQKEGSGFKSVNVHSASRIIATNTQNKVFLRVGRDWVQQAGDCSSGHIDATEIYCDASATHILPGTAGNAVWALTLNNSVVRSWDGGREYVGTPFVPVQIAGRSYVEAVAVDNQQRIWHYLNGLWQEYLYGRSDVHSQSIWASIGTDGSVWTVNAEGLVYNWDGPRNTWIGFPLRNVKTVHVHSVLRVVATQKSGDMFLRVGNDWPQQPGKCVSAHVDASKIYCDWSATHVLPSGDVPSDKPVTSTGAVWAITLDGSPVRSLGGLTGVLSTDRKLVQLSGRTYDEAVAVSDNDEIIHFANSKWSELQPGARAVWASIGTDGAIYAVNRFGQVYAWDATAKSFVIVLGGNIKYVHVHTAQRVVITSNDKVVLLGNGTKWVEQPGRCANAHVDASDIYCDAGATHVLPGGDDTAVWAISLSGQLVRSANGRKDYLNTSFQAVQVSGRSVNSAVAVDDKEHIWHFDGKSWSEFNQSARAFSAAIGKDGAVWIINRQTGRYQYWSSASGSFEYGFAYDGKNINVFDQSNVVLTNNQNEAWIPRNTPATSWKPVSGMKCERVSLDALRFYCDSAATHVLPSGAANTLVTPSIGSSGAFVSPVAPTPPASTTQSSGGIILATTSSIAAISNNAFAYSDSAILTFTSISQRDGLLQQVLNLVQALLAALGITNLNIVSVRDVALSGGSSQVFYKITGRTNKAIDVSSVLTAVQGAVKKGQVSPFGNLVPNFPGAAIQSGKDFALVDSALLTYTTIAQRDGLLQAILKLLQAILDLLGLTNLNIAYLADVAGSGNAKQVLYKITGQANGPVDVGSVLDSLHTSIGKAGIAGLGNILSSLLGQVTGVPGVANVAGSSGLLVNVDVASKDNNLYDRSNF